jgi:hypothetical protein
LFFLVFFFQASFFHKSFVYFWSIFCLQNFHNFSTLFWRFFFVVMSFAWDLSFFEFSLDDNEKRDLSILMKFIRSSSKTCQRCIKFLTENDIIMCHFDVDRFVCHQCASLNAACDKMNESCLILCRSLLIMTD